MLLGTAAGGGFPQWNCRCQCCRIARSDPARARPRTQSSIAVSADGRRWFLANASPDVREQLARLPVPAPDERTIRQVPIEGVVLSDAELDHSLGIALLREARRLDLWATRAVAHALEHDSRILPVTRAFADVSLEELPLDVPVALRCRDGSPSGLTVEAFPVPGDPPRFSFAHLPGHTVGLHFRDEDGMSCVFVPGCGAIDGALMERLDAASLVLFDGTFWSDDELIALGIGERRAAEMGHVPIAESLLTLLHCRAPVIYTHVNNTNPVLLEDSTQRAMLEGAGLTVGSDGLALSLSPTGLRGRGPSGVESYTTFDRVS